MLYLLFGIFYYIIGYLVGNVMYREGFSGTENEVKLVGGLSWPITIFMLLIALSGSEGIKK